MKAKIPCPDCFGQNPDCLMCRGTGFIWGEGEPEKSSSATCRSCQGRGFKIPVSGEQPEICTDCGGTGLSTVTEKNY